MSLEMEMRIRDLMDEPEQRALDAKVRRAGILEEVAAVQTTGNALDMADFLSDAAPSAIDALAERDFVFARECLVFTAAYALAAIEAIDAEGDSLNTPADEVKS